MNVSLKILSASLLCSAGMMAGSMGTAFAAGHCAMGSNGLPDLSGQSVTISGPWEGQDEKLVNSVIDCFETATGASVAYSGSGEFEQLIVTDRRSGSAHGERRWTCSNRPRSC
jgi:alpha-glucoside transport system substrate-binding protein